MAQWRVLGDLVVFECLRLRFHRIGRSHWRAGGVLRSWGAAALHRDGDTLHVSCADDEALWLGAWLEDDETAMASVTLTDSASGCSATMAPPDNFQIAGLMGPDGAQRPIVRSGSALSLDLRCGPASAAAALLLHTPDDWAALAGRPVPDKLKEPPLPPRLG